MSFDITEVSNQQLRGMEVGWREVNEGLGKALTGYLLFLAGFALLLAAPLTGSKPIFFIGFGLFLIIAPVSSCMILAGEWKCLYAPERYGSKWLVFGSMLCLLLIWALGIVLQVAPITKRELMFLQPTFWALNCLSLVLFVLFLVTVGLCWENNSLIGMAVCYLLFVGMLVLGSGYLIMTADIATKQTGDITKDIAASVKDGQTSLLVMLGFGWIASFFWYLLLIFITQGVIYNGVRSLKSPLGKQLA